jgi:hypothetical protein
VGAAAGLVVSTIGVLFTRGRATVVYPETPLTFSMQTPITLDNSQQAFRYASQYDYNARVAGPRPAYRSAYGPYPYAPGPYYAPMRPVRVWVPLFLWALAVLWVWRTLGLRRPLAIRS